MPDTESDLYTCTACGSGFNEPKRIRVCSSCGGVKTIKLTSALQGIAAAKARVAKALEDDDLRGFSEAQSDIIVLDEKLKPPSSC